MPDRLVAAPHVALGQLGERLAIEALQRLGYRFVEANWRCQAGELDAVLWDGDELVFLEVKTRMGASHGSAEESLSVAKERKLAVTAEWYLADHPEVGNPVWRIDLVAITIDRHGRVERFAHIANAALLG